MKKIAICLVAWPNRVARMEYLQETVRRLKRHLIASQHELKWVCSSESQDVTPEGVDWIRKFCFDNHIYLEFHKAAADFGGNMNHALDLGGYYTADYLYLVLDDWWLTQVLDLSVTANFLDNHPDFVIVRHGWSHRPSTTGVLDQKIDGHQEFDFAAGRYPYADHPHLRRRTWEQEMGRYQEGGDLGRPEVNMCGRLQTSRWRVALSEQRFYDHGGQVSSVVERCNPDTDLGPREGTPSDKD